MSEIEERQKQERVDQALEQFLAILEGPEEEFAKFLLELDDERFDLIRRFFASPLVKTRLEKIAARAEGSDEWFQRQFLADEGDKREGGPPEGTGSD